MPLKRRVFLRATAAAAAGILAPRAARARDARLRITHHRIPWDTPRRVRILQLTDVHVGWTTPRKVLDAAVQVAHGLAPDLVALTGDYVNHSLKHTAQVSQWVSRLPGTKLAVLGNHDHWSGAAGVREAVERGGARVLANERLSLELGGATMEVLGIDDLRTGHDDVPKAYDRLPSGARPLVLAHHPRTADLIAERGAGLVIAGHTHGGQIAVPGLTPALARMTGNPYLNGWYNLDRTPLYVSAGVGASLDGLRGGRSAVPEVAVFDLVPASQVRTRETRVAMFDGQRLVRVARGEEGVDQVLRAPSDDL